MVDNECLPLLTVRASILINPALSSDIGTWYRLIKKKKIFIV